MSKIQIVSKTKYGNSNFCVGGIELDTFKSLRLLNQNGTYPASDTPFKINQVWEIEYKPVNRVIPPHVEDVLVSRKTLLAEKYVEYPQLIRQAEIKRRLWQGTPANIFNGHLGWTYNMSGYISHSKVIPDCSTGFWIPDKELMFKDGYYLYQSVYQLKYVGLEKPIPIIPAYTLTRISLAKWWRSHPEIEERCYLQLSGWYS